MTDHSKRVKNLTQISSKEARQLLEAPDKALIYIGHDNCSECSNLAKLVAYMQKRYKQEIYYLDTQAEDFDTINRFRLDYQVATLPCFIAHQNTNTHVHCNANLSKLELEDFVNTQLTYNEDIANFQETTADVMEDKIQSQEDFILYVGKEVCPYCRRFVKKLAPVAEENQLDIYHVDSLHTPSLPELKAFRDRYDIKTVPGLMVSKAGQVRVVCDSSLSPEEILAFIQG